jgi:hypothetical protein
VLVLQFFPGSKTVIAKRASYANINSLEALPLAIVLPGGCVLRPQSQPWLISYFPLGVCLVRTSMTGFAAAGLLT